jgi:hypothetical protein
VTLPREPEPEHARLVTDNLLYLGQVHRFMSLARNMAELDVRVTFAAGDQPVPVVEGVPRLVHGQEFRIVVQNRASSPRYIYAVTTGPDDSAAGQESLQVLYPGVDELQALPPGQEAVIPPPAAQAFVANAADEMVRARLLVLAMDRPRPLSWLLIPPRTSVQRTSLESTDPLTGLLEHVLHGGERSQGQTAAPSDWASTLLLVDIAGQAPAADAPTQ